MLIAISAFIILVGVIGVIVPILPGVPLSWLGLFIYAYFTHFTTISLRVTIILLVLTVVVTILEFLLPILGAKQHRASKYGLWGAALGMLVGPFVLGPVGIILGPFLGAILGESYAGKNEQSLQSGIGVFIGFMLSMGAKFIVALVILGFFVASFF